MFRNAQQAYARTMRSRSGASWYSQSAGDWLKILLTAAATALFTTAGVYFATIRVENEKVRSSNVSKLANDFQVQFSSVIKDIQRFTSASIRDKKISDQDKLSLESSMLSG
jgi:hypothetical protein